MIDTVGDKDLFDVWDDADPVEAKAALLERILEELREGCEEHRHREALRLVVKLLAAVDDLRTRARAVRDELEAM